MISPFRLEVKAKISSIRLFRMGVQCRIKVFSMLKISMFQNIFLRLALLVANGDLPMAIRLKMNLRMGIAMTMTF